MAIIYAEQLEYMNLDSMQETHENEVKLLNEIAKLANAYRRDKSHLEALELKLDEYVEHVKEHFEFEEELMEEYDFHAYDMHKMAHDMFLMDLKYARKHWKQHGDIDKILSFVQKTPEWLIMHVSSVDKPTADYLATKIEK